MAEDSEQLPDDVTFARHIRQYAAERAQRIAAASGPDPTPAHFLTDRLLLAFLCFFPLFFSAGVASDGLIAAAEHLKTDIPAGRIEFVGPRTKVGTRIRLDNGAELYFPNDVLSARVRTMQDQALQLAVGDRVEKRRDSFDYVVNGIVVADRHWVEREYLFTTFMFVTLGVYLLAATLYVLWYGRTPLGEMFWRSERPDRPRRPRTRAGLLFASYTSWFAAVAVMTAFTGCFQGCIRGIVQSVK
jgi:hypothetical protein